MSTTEDHRDSIREILATLPPAASMRDDGALEESPYYWIGRMRKLLEILLRDEGDAVPSAPVECAACGDSDTELDEVVSTSLRDGSVRRQWYCHDITACSDRRHPGLAALLGGAARDAEAAQEDPERDPAIALQYGCGFCGALAGEPCRTRQGNIVALPHYSRTPDADLRDAEAAQVTR